MEQRIREVHQTALTPRPARIAAVPSLRRGTAWALGGNVAYSICQWAMIALLAKAGTRSDVGAFALAFALSAPVMLVAGLQLSDVQATDATRRFEFADYLRLRLLTTCAGVAVITILSFALGLSLTARITLLVIAAMKALDGLSDLCFGVLRRAERMDSVAAGLTFNGVASLALLALMFAITHSVIGAAIGSAAGSAMALVGVNAPAALRELRAKKSPASAGGGPELFRATTTRRAVQLAKLTLPLGVMAGLVSLEPNTPRYLIAHYRGAGELGIFAALSFVALAGGSIVASLGQAASARMGRCYAAGDREAFGRLVAKLVATGAVLGLGATLLSILAGRQILNAIYGPAYGRHVVLFSAVLAAATLAYLASPLNYAMIAVRAFGGAATVHVLSLLSVTVAGLVLIPSARLTGAVISMVAGGIVHAIGAIIVVLRAFHGMALVGLGEVDDLLNQ